MYGARFVAAPASVDLGNAVLRQIPMVRKGAARYLHRPVHQSADAARRAKQQIGKQLALFEVPLRIHSIVAADAKLIQAISVRLTEPLRVAFHVVRPRRFRGKSIMLRRTTTR